jgi:hypothetical protein
MFTIKMDSLGKEVIFRQEFYIYFLQTSFLTIYRNETKIEIHVVADICSDF